MTNVNSIPDSSAKILPILLGSGVSCAAHLDGIESLSRKVRECFHELDQQSFFGSIKALCEESRGILLSNYEDWLYLTIQIRDHLLGDYENPALIPLVASVVSRTGLGRDTLPKVCDEIILAALKTVCAALRSDQAKPEDAYMKLSDSLRTRQEMFFRFFSLNHDTLLEQFFRHSGVSYYDGFASLEEVSNGRRFRFDRIKFQDSPVSLLKLHGSINWWRHRALRARNEENPWLYEFIGVDIDDNRTFERMDETPLILAGTFNKILQYSSPVFLQLFAEFHHTLQQSCRLLVSGYGFGDKGINSIIADWMSESTDRHLYVIDPEPFHTERCRGAILGKVEAWSSENRLHVSKKRIGVNIDWDEIISVTLH